jgi:ribosomal-protein-alanine N-acetyltransferase
MKDSFLTARLLLNLITENDHDFVIRLLNTDGWIQFIGNRNIHSTGDAIDYIRKIKNTPDFLYWIVRVKDTGTPIGIVSFLKRNYLDHFDIGFAFLPEFSGQGYAYEAANKVLSAVKKMPAYATILATTLPTNIKSIRLLTKLGFHFEREIERDSVKLQLYCILAN